MKFKEHDLVVIVNDSKVLELFGIANGTRGVICQVAHSAYSVDFGAISHAIYEHEIELEHIYDSPLYKALR